MDRISIIVPAYNVADYLPRCIESLVSQTYKNIEIILVNDGSKDQTGDICDMFAKKDSRIQVIHTSNQGVAQARNEGMSRATGKYIGFVDPDDWIEDKMYERLYNRMIGTTYPVCLCHYYKDKTKAKPQYFPFYAEALERDEVIRYMITNMIGMDGFKMHNDYIMGCVWRGLYLRSFLEAHHIQFVKGISIMEDLVFMIEVLLKSHGIAIENTSNYHYVQNPKSVLHSYNPRMWEDQMKVHRLLEERLKEAGLEAYMRSRLDLRYLGMGFSAMYNEIIRNTNEVFRVRVKRSIAIYNEPKFRETLERIKWIRRGIPAEEVMIVEILDSIEEHVAPL